MPSNFMDDASNCGRLIRRSDQRYASNTSPAVTS